MSINIEVCEIFSYDENLIIKKKMKHKKGNVRLYMLFLVKNHEKNHKIFMRAINFFCINNDVNKV